MTSVILFESAGWIADFSALKAARAFEAIEKYAANLINQPWRKEFREIKVRKQRIFYVNLTKEFRLALTEGSPQNQIMSERVFLS